MSHSRSPELPMPVPTDKPADLLDTENTPHLATLKELTADPPLPAEPTAATVDDTHKAKGVRQDRLEDREASIAALAEASVANPPNQYVATNDGLDAESVIVACLRCPPLFEEARTMLDAKMIRAAHPGSMAEVWEAFQKVGIQGTETVDEKEWRRAFQLVADELMQRASDGCKELLKGAGWREGLLKCAFAASSAAPNIIEGRRLLRQFILKTTLLKPIRDRVNAKSVLDQDPQALIDSIAKVTQRFQEAEAATADPFMTPEDFDQREFKLAWLVPKVLVANQPCIVGGPSKVLKTSVMVDLAVSLGLGGDAKFLDHFPVKGDPVKVGFMSGESGGATIQETFRRVCRMRNAEVSKCNVYTSLELPRLSDSKHLRGLAIQIRKHDLKVIIIDPIYLALLAGNAKANPANVMEMGPLLLGIARACLDVECTPILVHHTVKRPANRSGGFKGSFEPIEREDLAMAGFSEFARQWMLVNRRSRYDDSGRHELWFSVGGSVGFGRLYAVDIDEGQINEDFGGRRWSVKVSKPDEVRAILEQTKQEKKKQKDEEDRLAAKERLVQAMQSYPSGETPTQLGSDARVPKQMSPKLLLDELVSEGRAKPCTVKKDAGPGKREYRGYRPPNEFTDVDPENGQ